MFQWNPVTKEQQIGYKRREPKRGVKGKFDPKTKAAIIERDNGQCVRCGSGSDLESVPHHIIYKSQGGLGTVDNGVVVCRTCHRLAHKHDAVRRWFEKYREEKLLNV
jgi:5-methylcytosine-specific restriction endonuclease McrA